MLRAFRGDPDWQPNLDGTNVVAELLDPQNVEVIQHDDWIGDVIVSNRQPPTPTSSRAPALQQVQSSAART
jgi:hypothetical protein